MGRALCPPAALSVPRRLEVAALERVVRISAKPTKRLQDALQPILAKHGLSPQQVALRLVSRRAVGQGLGQGQGQGQGRADRSLQPGEKQPLDLGKLVSSVAAQRLVLDTLPGRVLWPWGLVPQGSSGPRGRGRRVFSKGKQKQCCSLLQV